MAAGMRIDPALADELRRARAEGRTDTAIPVAIEHRSPLVAQGVDLADLEARSAELQAALLGRLHDLGVHDIKRTPLANALFAELTPAQIEAIAAHPDVRIVRLNRAVDVRA